MRQATSASAAAHRARAIERLIELGFEEDPNADSSPEIKLYRDFEVDADGRSVEALIEVSIGADFPYQKPRVRDLNFATGKSWHRDSEGGLCLWPDDGSVADLPWKDPDVLVERIELWLRNSATGWQDDLPVLDLDRYFGAKVGRFLMPESEIPGQTFFTLVERGLERAADTPAGICGIIYEIGRYVAGPPLGVKKRGRWSGVYGASLHVGELDVPFTSWGDLVSRVDPALAKKLTDFARFGTLKVIVVGYSRGGNAGRVVLKLGRQNKRITIEGALEPVPSDIAVRRQRAGTTESQLREKAVAVVGVGAVGSYVADLLVRRGVQQLTLVDGDSMRPGNSIRHLVGARDLELERKVGAVKTTLESYGFVAPSIETRFGYLLTIDDAWSLVASHDLVIDATASGTGSALLADLASDTGTPVVQVCLQRVGGVIRVDRYPLRTGESHYEAIPELDSAPLLFEYGCGDPVSPTTPDSVVEAAVWAVRMAIDILLEKRELGPSVIVVANRQPDQPLDRLGVVVA